MSILRNPYASPTVLQGDLEAKRHRKWRIIEIPLLSPAPGQRCILCSGLCGIRSQDGKVFAWISFCSESVKASALESKKKGHAHL